ncbi:WbqC family protein [Dickeya chrysanthemi]|uniref:WbqC family protein n=1 Tax=Dickeya chrysanthemi TaxID=556 RepID=UPI0018CFE1BF|nr:WbqC family protein [Dickeya chrysanthemi]
MGKTEQARDIRLAIMQPYFFPYIGYFQLISSVDKIVIYDNVKYTKKGWINRNRILVNNKDVVFSLPLKKASDYLTISERSLADTFYPNELLSKIHGAYGKAPCFQSFFPVLESIISSKEKNLFLYIYNSIVELCKYLGIKTEFIISSHVSIDHALKGQEKVLALCEALQARKYINAIGGAELYSKETFREKNIELKFIKTTPFEYKQYNNNFIPWLSIIDVMMFNSCDTVRELIETNYELI